MAQGKQDAKKRRKRRDRHHSIRATAARQARGGKRQRRELVPDRGFVKGDIEAIRLRTYYPPTRDLYDVSDRVISFSWSDAVDQAAVQVDVELDNYDAEIGELMNRPGLVLFLETRTGGHKFRERLRAVAFTTAINEDTGTVQITAYDHLMWLQLATGTFTYSKDDKHKKGWRADEIAIDIAKKFGIPLAVKRKREQKKGKHKKGHKKAHKVRIARGTYRIPYFHNQGSVYETIAKAYKVEMQHSKHHFLMEADKGRLVIRRGRNTRSILALTDESNVRSASYTRDLTDHFGTVTTPTGGDRDGNKRHRRDRDGDHHAHGRKDKERRKKQNEREEATTAAEMLFGKVRFNSRLPNVKDKDWTRKAAQALVDRAARAQKTVRVQAAGNLYVRQGDRLFTALDFADHSMRRTLFVASVTHTITAGDYTMDLELVYRQREVDLDIELTGQELHRESSTVDTGGGGKATGRVVRGKVSYFSNTGQSMAGGGQPNDVPGIALNINPGTDSGWNNSTTRKWLNQRAMFRVEIQGHVANLPVTDMGPAGSTGRAIDVTLAGARKMGFHPPNFPTDAVGTATLLE
jgi:hypothetical protein